MRIGDSDSLRIGMVAPVIGGGIKTHLNNVVPLLRKKGHDVMVLTSYGQKLDFDVINLRAIGFPMKLYGLTPGLLPAISRMSRNWDVINIHGYSCFPADLFTILRFVHKKPIILTLHGSFSQYTTFVNLFAKRIHNCFMARFVDHVDKFIAVSEAEKSRVIQDGLPPGRIEVVYNGIDEKYSRFDPSCKETTPSKKAVLYVGRLSGSKNLELLLEAMKLVVTKKRNVKLILAGPDSGELKNLKSLASQFDIDEYIEFTGEVTEVKKFQLLTSSDVFVHPSLQDTFSISILEACAVGLPVVAFDVGGNHEMILNGQTGLLVGDSTGTALANAILLTLQDPAVHTLAAKGRDFVLKKFSWNKTVNSLETIYQNVLVQKED